MVATEHGKLKIVTEGKVQKFIERVQQITFSADYARERNKTVLYITERAVFKLVDQTLELIEIAPGIDLERDILQQMQFMPRISKALKLMDSRIFVEQPMGLVLKNPLSKTNVQ